MGMPDFDRTFTSFNMQDEQACQLVNPYALINATAFNKVKNAFASAFALAPAFA